MRRIYCTVTATLTLGVAATAAFAQQNVDRAARAGATTSISLRGTVVDDVTDAPLAYAIVSIPVLGLDRFTDERGRFAFVGIRAGTHRIRVRQLGRTPREMDVVVSETHDANVRIALSRIVRALAAVRVSEEWECRMPGRPLPKDADVFAIFEQLEQNAERLRLLAATYPHVIETERRFSNREANGNDVLERVDTIVVNSEASSRYRAGRMIAEERGAGRARVRYLRIPTLLDFASPEFQRAHCFLYRGVDRETGETMYRIDFKASSKLRSADVHGSVYLDTATYMLRRTDIRLSRVPGELRGLAGVDATTFFAELRPGLPVIGAIKSVNAFDTSGRIPPRYTAAVEDQRPLLVRFLRSAPE